MAPPDPFGNISFQTGPESASNPFRFSSTYADQETGLLYYGYRYMHPAQGRWLSRDPIGEQGVTDWGHVSIFDSAEKPQGYTAPKQGRSPVVAADRDAMSARYARE